jgi:hypothetical protein
VQKVCPLSLPHETHLNNIAFDVILSFTKATINLLISLIIGPLGSL